MKFFDLIVVSGSKASEKQIFQLLSGKNLIGTNIKCSTQIDLKQIEPQHFELLVTKNGRITLIPLVKNMQIKSKKSTKMTELSPYECYDIEKDQSFYIDRTYSLYVSERITKKSVQKSEETTSKVSLWSPISKDKLKTTNKKIKTEEVPLIEEESESQSVQSKINDDEDSKTEDDEYFEEEIVYSRKNKNKKQEQQTEKKNNNKVSDKKNNKRNNSSCETSILVDEKKSKQSKSQKSKQIKQNTCRVVLSNCELTKAEKQKMIELGVTFVENQDEEFDVVVMESFRRRAKLLIGLNKQAKIVNKNWILDCIDDNELIDEYSQYYLELSKEDQEKYIDFDLDAVQLKNIKNKGFQIFKNQEFCLQQHYNNVSIEDLQSIIKNGGGNIIDGITANKKNVKQFLVIGKEDEFKFKKSQKKATLVDPEYILLSSLKQEIQKQWIYKN